MQSMAKAKDALDALGPLEKRAFILVKYDGLSLKNAAARLHVDERTTFGLAAGAFAKISKAYNS